MKIESFRDFEKLVKLCRKNGIKTITVDNVTMELGPLPAKTKVIRETSGFIEENVKVPVYQGEVEPEKVEAEELTDEQKLFWSAAPGGISETTEVQ